MNLQPLFRISQFMSAVRRIRDGGGQWKVTYGPGYTSMIGASGMVNGEQVADDLTLADVDNFLALADTFWECRDQSKTAAGVNLVSLQKELQLIKDAAMHPGELDVIALRARVIACLTLVRAVMHYRATDKATAPKIHRSERP